jgi:hypothetical protein
MARAEATETKSDASYPPASEPLTVERLLAEAAARIAIGWCQTSLAEDARGRQVEPWAESARCWSVLGALLGVWVDARCPSGEVLETAYAALALATGGRPEEWNAAPWRTRRHVLSAFGRARGNVPAARRQLRARSRARD